MEMARLRGGHDEPAGDAREPLLESSEQGEDGEREERREEVLLTNTVLVRNWLAFFLFGFINNFAYVVMYSGATQILNKRATVGLLEIFNILPSLIIKLLQPWVMHLVPYWVRVVLVVVIQVCSFVLVGVWGEASLPMALLGVACASASSGVGEPTFLALTSYYHPSTVAAPWGFGMGSAQACRAMAFLPTLMLAGYWLLLTGPTRSTMALHKHTAMQAEGAYHSPTGSLTLGQKMATLQPLAIFIVSLVVVYFSEYTINSGITPALGFGGIDHYSVYATVYQVGVFISRSSVQLLHIRQVWWLAALQALNLLLLLPAAYYQWLPNVWVACGVIFWVGLLGGGVYVNAFYAITHAFTDTTREFALTVTSVGDGVGILLSSLVSIPLQHWLCCHVHCPAYPCTT